VEVVVLYFDFGTLRPAIACCLPPPREVELQRLRSDGRIGLSKGRTISCSELNSRLGGAVLLGLCEVEARDTSSFRHDLLILVVMELFLVSRGVFLHELLNDLRLGYLSRRESLRGLLYGRGTLG